MIKRIRKHLGLKIFLSYLVVIIVGMIVLATAAEFAIPSAFDRHLSSMDTMMDGSMMMNTDLFNNFQAASNQTLFLAGSAAFIVAVFISLIISRQLVTPIREMMLASQHISEGHYQERVNIPGGSSHEETDELGQLAMSFNRMADNLERTESLRRQLIGDVAHELRTPLTTIKGSMEGLVDGVLPNEIKTFQQIYREADRLQRLVNDLQELSRVENGVFELKSKPIPPYKLMELVIDRLARQFEEKGVTLISNLDKNLPPVLADEDRITQVVINLVGNALQYTPSGGNVTIDGEKVDGKVCIAVSDTGVGIRLEHIPQIFDRFYRVDKSRSRAGGGSGIGLTIAKHLVEAHGGKIWAESPGPDQGSKFSFTLPLA
jgi:signal transduction histidine kinase